VTQLLQRLHDELVRRHYATTTRESYLRIVRAFHRHAGGRLDRVGPDDLRRYQVYLLTERKLAVGTVVAEIAALRFFFLRVLKRRDMKEDLPYPKHRKRLPVVLSPEEVQRLIAGAKNLYHRTMLLTLYTVMKSSRLSEFLDALADEGRARASRWRWESASDGWPGRRCPDSRSAITSSGTRSPTAPFLWAAPTIRTSK